MPTTAAPTVSVQPKPVVCNTHTGEKLYGFTVMDVSRADAVLHEGRYRFGKVAEANGHYLLTQGTDTWRFPKSETQAVLFNLSPEYRAELEQQTHTG